MSGPTQFPERRAAATKAAGPIGGGSGRNRRVTVVALAVLAAMIGVGLYQSLAGPGRPGQTEPGSTDRVTASPTPTAGAGAPAVVRDDSHRLSTAPDSKVTLVEFLDFECESCRAVYPAVEQLRQLYQGRVTFVARYFPLDSHFNAMRAARAVEAAARQGQFEAMYSRMFTTQTEWGEQQIPQDDRFRGYAADLGLDMARWDVDYNAPATEDRIRVDIADGTALGVTGTPTFFLNGKLITPQSYEDLTTALDAELAAR